MTIIVAHVSGTAAVMASDSRASEEDSTASTVEKIWTSGGLLFAYSGHLALREALRAAIDLQLSSAPLPAPIHAEMASSNLCAIARPILDNAYRNFVGAPGDDPTDKIGGALIVIGHDGSEYWILEIDKHNTPSYYTNDGFHTIGSGSLAAHVSRGLLRHYGLPGDEAKYLRLLAYRSVATCIEVLGGAYGLGFPVQLWQSAPHGYEQVGAEELSAVEEGVEQWIGIERESLRQVFAVAGLPVEEPLPEPLPDSEPRDAA